MKKLAAALVVAILTQLTPAQAQCRYASPGTTMYIFTRSGTLYAPGFTAKVACTRYTPSVVRWQGGRFCIGATVYGWTAQRKPFSCRVLRFGW